MSLSPESSHQKESLNPNYLVSANQKDIRENARYMCSTYSIQVETMTPLLPLRGFWQTNKQRSWVILSWLSFFYVMQNDCQLLSPILLLHIFLISALLNPSYWSMLVKELILCVTPKKARTNNLSEVALLTLLKLILSSLPTSSLAF